MAKANAKPKAPKKGLPVPLQALLSVLLIGYMVLVYLTSRRTVHGEKPQYESPALFPYWHGRLALTLGVFPTSTPLTGLVSPHGDGRIAAFGAKLIGRRTVAGSTKYGALDGAKKMILAAKNGSSLLITPDAPPLPAYQAAAGVVELARLAEIPIIPCAVSVAHGKQLNNKDRMILPRPFTHVHVAYGDAIMVPKKATKAKREAALKTVEASLRSLCHTVDTAAGHAEWSM